MSGKARVRIHEHGGAANLYIPKDVVSDTSFPFGVDDWKDLMVEISGRCLVIRRRRDGER